MKIKNSFIIGLGIMLILSSSIQAVTPKAPILSEDFEDGVLDSHISIKMKGTFLNKNKPGIKPITKFGSTKVFGFGRTTCGANCWLSNVTGFKVSFPNPTFVSSISFKEMELKDNWGSGGGLFIDGKPLSKKSRGVNPTEFGRLPYNDRKPDRVFRSQKFIIGREVTTIEIRVVDITDLSEIYIDDLQINQ